MFSAGDAHQQHEFILKQMWPDPATGDYGASEQDLVDLVFVHGMGGNLKTTWKQEKTAEPWFTKPEFLHPLEDSVRVLSFGYNAYPLRDGAIGRIADHANDLLRNIIHHRYNCPNRPILFIAHSLGGLVVKKAVLLSATNAEWTPIKKATGGIIFLGTPHFGSDNAKPLHMVQTMVSALKRITLGTSLSTELAPWSTSIEDLGREFTPHVYGTIELLCFYEKVKQKIGLKYQYVVPKESAILPGVSQMGAGCTHTEMSKFKDPSESRFLVFWGEVGRMVRLAKQRSQSLSVFTSDSSGYSLVGSAPTLPAIGPPAEPETESPKEPHMQLIHAKYSWTDADIFSGSDEGPAPSQALRRRRTGKDGAAMASKISASRKEAGSKLPADKKVVINKQTDASKDPVSKMQPVPEKGEDIDPVEIRTMLKRLDTINDEHQGFGREPIHWETCKWIQEDAAFLQFVSQDKSGFLFITGNAGCGKSHLAKYIQDLLPNQDPETKPQVLAFYCDSIEGSNANPPILDLLVGSILEQNPSLFRAIKPKARTSISEAGTKFSMNHLMELAHTLVTDKDARLTYLVIDGLDQCAEDFVHNLLKGLDIIFKRDLPITRLKIIITSRLNEPINGYTWSYDHIIVTPERTQQDIKAIVESEVGTIFRARNLPKSDVESVNRVILERAHGSFLFATSAMKALWHLEDTTSSAIFTLLTSGCPSTMEEIYRDDMHRLEAGRPDLFRLIQCHCVARRPLKIWEAQGFIDLMNPHAHSANLAADLRRLCPRLVKNNIDEKESLQLLHPTLHEFMKKAYDLAEINHIFAKACLKALTLTVAEWDDAIYKRRGLAWRGERAPYVQLGFLEYAAFYVNEHLKLSGDYAREHAFEIWELFSSEGGAKWKEYHLSTNVPPMPRAPTPTSTSSSRSRASSISLDSVDAPSATTASEDISADEEASSDEDEPRPTPPTPTETGDETPMKDQKVDVLMLLAGWDVAPVIKELFFRVLELPRRPFWERAKDLVLSQPSRQPARDEKEFRILVNTVSMGSTAIHHSAIASPDVVTLLLPYVDNVNAMNSHGATPLMLAATKGWGSSVKELLKAGAQVDLRDKWGQTALYLAILNGNAATAHILLEHGADPNVRSSNGYTLLEVIVGANNAELARTLLQFRPNVSDLTTNGQPPAFLASNLESYAVLEELIPHVDTEQEYRGERLIHHALWSDQGRFVKMLISRGTNLFLGPEGVEYATPVFIAAERGLTDTLRDLLAAGASPQPPKWGDETALHAAAWRKGTECCRLLLNEGASPDAYQTSEETPLYLAVSDECKEVVELLVERGANPNLPTWMPSFVIAADVEDVEIMKLLLAGQGSPDVNLADKVSDTALGLVAKTGNLEIASLLLDHDADPSKRSGLDNPSNMPLQIALEAGNIDVALELLSRGAIRWPSDITESSPLHMACETGSEAFVQAFIDMEDDPERVNRPWGWKGSPLLAAAQGGQPRVFNMLLEMGADPNYVLRVSRFAGKTLMHAAADGGSVEILTKLLEVIENKDVNVRDDTGNTPIWWAVRSGYPDMIRALVERGARTDVVTDFGDNLVLRATKGGNADVLDLLLELDPQIDCKATNKDGATAIMWASTRNQTRVLDLLLSHGATVNQVDLVGQSALMVAACLRKHEFLRALLQVDDLDMLQKDCFGRNVLQLALSYGEAQTVNIVLNAAHARGTWEEMLSNRDIFNMTAADHTKLGRLGPADHELHVRNIRETAQDLLDNFEMSGAKWEKLAQFLLRTAHEQTFAQIAFWRNCKRDRSSILVAWEYLTQCAACCYTITTARWICRECVDINLCHSCYTSALPQIRWRCRHQKHGWYRLEFPNYVPSEDSSSSSSSGSDDSDDSDDDSEAASSTGGSSVGGEGEASDGPKLLEGPERSASPANDGKDSGIVELPGSGLQLCSIPEVVAPADAAEDAEARTPITNGDAPAQSSVHPGSDDILPSIEFESEPTISKTSTFELITTADAESREESTEATSPTHGASPTAEEFDLTDVFSVISYTHSYAESHFGTDFSNPTEEDMRRYLIEVLKAFPSGCTKKDCYSGQFDKTKWKTVASEDPLPPLELPAHEKTRAGEVLACLPYRVTREFPLYLPASRVPWHGFHQHAMSRATSMWNELYWVLQYQLPTPGPGRELARRSESPFVERRTPPVGGHEFAFNTV